MSQVRNPVTGYSVSASGTLGRLITQLKRHPTYTTSGQFVVNPVTGRKVKRSSAIGRIILALCTEAGSAPSKVRVPKRAPSKPAAKKVARQPAAKTAPSKPAAKRTSASVAAKKKGDKATNTSGMSAAETEAWYARRLKSDVGNLDLDAIQDFVTRHMRGYELNFTQPLGQGLSSVVFAARKSRAGSKWNLAAKVFRYAMTTEETDAAVTFGKLGIAPKVHASAFRNDGDSFSKRSGGDISDQGIMIMDRMDRLKLEVPLATSQVHRIRKLFEKATEGGYLSGDVDFRNVVIDKSGMIFLIDFQQWSKSTDKAFVESTNRHNAKKLVRHLAIHGCITPSQLALADAW